VIVGSGATAVTLVPAMADRAARVTMLQRSPTYISSVPSQDRSAARLRRLLPERLAYPLVRWKSILLGVGIFQLSRRRPGLMKALLRRGAMAQLPAGFDVDTHLAPRYDPWDQRLCVAPDGDLFRALGSGRAEIVTDRIERVTATGVRLASGRELPADLLVLATGLNLLAIGAITLAVAGREVSVPDTLAYKGLMLAGVPNFALTVGYTNASWTLRADLAARYVIRLLQHLDRHGYQTATPLAPDGEGAGSGPSLLDLQAGYVRRGEALLPRQGSAAPWQLPQNYLRDVLLMRLGPVTDGVRFGHAGQTTQPDGSADAPLRVR
jgi:monooxygenase